MRITFMVQLVFNLFYLCKYIVVLMCSQEIRERIKKFYGKKYFAEAEEEAKNHNITSNTRNTKT
jgi:hypothetical protein